MGLKINGEPFQLLQSLHPDQSEQDIVVEIDNSEGGSVNAQLRLTDVTEDDPDGRFRLRVAGTSLYWERATSPQWASYETLLTLDGSQGGISRIVFTEDGLADLLERLSLQIQNRGPLGILWNELVALGLLSG